MDIQVTCPGCLKRFSVSEKFAGKSGPCPNCKKQIKVPEKKDAVVIHAPETGEPKDHKGRSIFKPIRRTEVKLSMPVILATALSSIVVLGIALGLRLSGSGEGPPTALLVVAALLLAPPLVYAGYWFLHDEELEGFRGRPLLIRCGICALAFAAIWGLYAVLPGYVSGAESLAEISGLQLVIWVPIMIALGAAVSVATLELELAQGIMHYVLYFGATFLLAWLAGTPLASPLAAQVDPVRGPPTLQSSPPASGGTTEAAPAKAAPKLLQ